MNLDFGRSTTITTPEFGILDMARPLPCWCRTGESVPLEQNRLLQWVRRQRELLPERLVREGAFGMGRGRPLLVFSSSSSDTLSNSSDDEPDYVGAYRRVQRRIVVRSVHYSERARGPPPRWAARATNGIGSSSSSRLENQMRVASVRAGGMHQAGWSSLLHASSVTPAGRGASDTGMSRAEDMRRGTPAAAPRTSSRTVRSRLPALTTSTQVLRGRPVTALRSQMLEAARRQVIANLARLDASGDHEEAPILFTHSVPMPVAGLSPRRVRSFDPAEYSHPYDLNPWRESWPRAHSLGTSDDTDELSNEDEEDDDEDEPRIRRFPGQSSLEDSFSSGSSEISTELVYSTVRSLSSSSADHTTPRVATPPPLQVEPVPHPTHTRFLEIRGLVGNWIRETVYDVLASYIGILDLIVFRADDGVGARLELDQYVPISWICYIAESVFTSEGEPRPLVFAVGSLR